MTNITLRCSASCCAVSCSGKFKFCFAISGYCPIIFHLIFYIMTVSMCVQQCGVNTLCSGPLNNATTFACSCISGYYSPTGDGKNCTNTLTSSFSTSSSTTSFSSTATSYTTTTSLTISQSTSAITNTTASKSLLMSTFTSTTIPISSWYCGMSIWWQSRDLRCPT